MAKTTLDTWQPKFYSASNLFHPIKTAFIAMNQQSLEWPTLIEYKSLLDTHSSKIMNHLNLPIQFVNQANSCPTYESQYEPRIYLKGEVQTRLKNWHDFFQVLVWKTFPKTKVLLNTLHYQASSKRLTLDSSNKQRTSLENFITLFDECGVIIISHNAELLDMIKEFQWETLFWENRGTFNSDIACFTFGHAMYEKAINPYIGMTANAILIQVDRAFFESSKEQQLQQIDTLVTSTITKEHADIANLKRLLTPFPLLGVPGWHRENNKKSFYLNEHYFRKKRLRK